VVIRSSSARQVQQLVAELGQPDAVRREAAIVRLRVLGSRTVSRLSALVGRDSPPALRASALRALEGIDDPRVPEIALKALGDHDEDVRLAAIATLRGWVAREAGTGIMEALVTLALERSQASSVRLAALDALSELPRDIVQPVLEQASVESAGPAAGEEEPAAIQEWLDSHPDASLSTLHAVIDRIHEHERTEPHAARRAEWLTARGAVHARLAVRQSRVALYDLREAFDAAAAPLPLDFLTAVTAIGDASCLEPMARAWATSPSEAWWRTRLAEAAAEILRRNGLTRRHAVVKRIRDRWPGFLQ
jgi:hypothetical protein